jgi:hypothetical protein
MLVSAFLLPFVYLIKLLLNLTLLLDCFSLDMARQFSVLERNILKVRLNWSDGALILRKSIPKARLSWPRPPLP